MNRRIICLLLFGLLAVVGSRSVAYGDLLNAPKNGATFFGQAITPHVDDLSDGVVKTFTGGRVTPSVTQAETVLYRVWGEESWARRFVLDSCETNFSCWRIKRLGSRPCLGQFPRLAF